MNNFLFKIEVSRPPDAGVVRILKTSSEGEIHPHLTPSDKVYRLSRLL